MPGRRQLLLSISACAIVTLIAFGVSRLDYYQRTGSFVPIRIVESLHSPVAVTTWTADGLSLADGRTLQLRWFRSLPSASPALTEMIKRGVEVGGDGRVYGLVAVHHWCGNDPVEEHVARVELSEVLTFLGQGVSLQSAPERNWNPKLQFGEGRFSDRGWDFSEFMMFETVRSLTR